MTGWGHASQDGLGPAAYGRGDEASLPGFFRKTLILTLMRVTDKILPNSDVALPDVRRQTVAYFLHVR